MIEDNKEIICNCLQQDQDFSSYPDESVGRYFLNCLVGTDAKNKKGGEDKYKNLKSNIHVDSYEYMFIKNIRYGYSDQSKYALNQSIKAIYRKDCKKVNLAELKGMFKFCMPGLDQEEDSDGISLNKPKLIS